MKGRIGVCPHLHRGLSPSCPDPSYKLNCYPTKMHSALIKAMVANCGAVPGGRQVTAPMSMREWFYRRTPADAGATHRFGDFGIRGWSNHKGGNYRIWLVGAEGSNAGLDAARAAWEEN